MKTQFVPIPSDNHVYSFGRVDVTDMFYGWTRDKDGEVKWLL